MLIDIDLETEGKAIVLEGLQALSVLRDLQAALVEPEADVFELDLSRLPDLELEVACGLFTGLCRTIDLEKYRRSFWFCFALLQLCLGEIERRPAEEELVH